MSCRCGMLVSCVVMWCSILGGGCSHFYKKDVYMDIQKIIEKHGQGVALSAADVVALFPHTVQQVNDYAAGALKKAQIDLDDLLAFSDQERTFDNTIGALDSIRHHLCVVAEAMSVLEMIHPDQAIRSACQESFLTMQRFLVDAFHQKRLYQACKAYQTRSELLSVQHQPEEQLLLDETMREFTREGLHLPQHLLDEVIQLKKDMAALSLSFESAIAQDTSSFVVGKDALDGVSVPFIESCERDAQGAYIIRCNTPSYLEIMEHCSVADTRKKMYELYNKRAYPANEQVLIELLEKRQKVATLLGFEHYAQFQIDDTMAKTPARVHAFLREIEQRVVAKAQKEIETWSQDVPASVGFDGKAFDPWSFGFVKNYFKKNYLAVDEHELAEYFPVATTLEGVFNGYQSFLGLSFSIAKPRGAWHESVDLITISDAKTKELIGYLFVDLYPRDNKYTHACMAGLLPSLVNQKSGKASVAAALIIANFPQPTAGLPALLKFDDVVTFFHEFGHAMHYILGATRFSAFAGTNVKSDFVETPSQMFEEWMYDETILQQVSCHYKTKQPLAPDMIKKIRAIKHFDSGTFVLRQLGLSMYALTLHEKKSHPCQLWDEIARTYMPFIKADKENKFFASFGHLASDLYASKYYNYLWAKVYALDVFYAVKERGLFDPEVGKTIRNEFLGKGGSVAPDLILKNVLKRPASVNAFFDDMGV